jgi:hypothetical protein
MTMNEDFAVVELPYHITVNDVPLHTIDDTLNRVIEFLEDNGLPLRNPNIAHQSLLDGELTTYGGLKYNQYFEYYHCKGSDKFRLYYYRYFTQGGGPVDYMGILVMLDDQALAMQLKLMLA